MSATATKEKMSVRHLLIVLTGIMITFGCSALCFSTWGMFQPVVAESLGVPTTAFAMYVTVMYLTMTVASVGETVDDQALVLLRSSQNAEEAAGLRQESCRVVFRTNEGIRVSKKALYINEEGETGVYVAVGYTARFRPVRILAEDDDFYLVRAAPKDVDDKRVLKTGDDVIVSSVELYNGKVVR